MGLISQTKEGLDRIDDFITSIPNTYQFLELNMNHIAPVKESFELSNKYNFNYVLPLNKPYHLQKESYSKKLKKKSKKADSNGLQLLKHDAPQNLIQLFRSDKGSLLLILLMPIIRTLNRLCMLLLISIVVIWMAYGKRNRALAGFFIIWSKANCSFIHWK